MAGGAVQPKGTGGAKANSPGVISGTTSDYTKVWFPTNSGGGRQERMSASSAENYAHPTPAQAKSISRREPDTRPRGR